MRSSTIQPGDVPAEVPCGQPYPYNDLPGDITCVRPLRHDWEHAARLAERHHIFQRREDDRRLEWVWWHDLRPLDVPTEEARLQASAYVAGNLALQVAKHTALLTLRHRIKIVVPLMVLAVLLSVYATLAFSQIYVDECVLRERLSPTRASVCDWIFPGDAPITPGRQELP